MQNPEFQRKNRNSFRRKGHLETLIIMVMLGGIAIGFVAAVAFCAHHHFPFYIEWLVLTGMMIVAMPIYGVCIAALLACVSCITSAWEWAFHPRFGKRGNAVFYNGWKIIAYWQLDDRLFVVGYARSVGISGLSVDREQAQMRDWLLETGVPHYPVRKEELQKWVEEWGTDEKLRNCLKKGIDRFESPSHSVIDLEANSLAQIARINATAGCLWRLHREPSVRQRICHLILWKALLSDIVIYKKPVPTILPLEESHAA